MAFTLLLQLLKYRNTNQTKVEKILRLSLGIRGSEARIKYTRREKKCHFPFICKGGITSLLGKTPNLPLTCWFSPVIILYLMFRKIFALHSEHLFLPPFNRNLQVFQKFCVYILGFLLCMRIGGNVDDYVFTALTENLPTLLFPHGCCLRQRWIC